MHFKPKCPRGGLDSENNLCPPLSALSGFLSYSALTLGPSCRLHRLVLATFCPQLPHSPPLQAPAFLVPPLIFRNADHFPHQAHSTPVSAENPVPQIFTQFSVSVHSGLCSPLRILLTGFPKKNPKTSLLACLLPCLVCFLGLGHN